MNSEICPPEMRVAAKKKKKEKNANAKRNERRIQTDT